jgi:hypothetical protein
MNNSSNNIKEIVEIPKTNLLKSNSSNNVNNNSVSHDPHCVFSNCSYFEKLSPETQQEVLMGRMTYDPDCAFGGYNHYYHFGRFPREIQYEILINKIDNTDVSPIIFKKEKQKENKKKECIIL